jgi:prepilin signal peptidase PulO-like enzyme (type II secretory pathway)
MIIFFALLGLLVGGLVNQLGSDLPAFAMSQSREQGGPGGLSGSPASDLPARRRLTRPHCPRCGQDRPWWQWLALPSYLTGRARCPHCDTRISLRHPLVELGLAVTFGYLWLSLGPTLNVRLVLYLIYSTIFALVLITDLERRLILNVVMYPSILLAIAASFFTPEMRWWSALIGGGIGFVFFLVAVVVGTAVFGSGALGQGDITLATFVGLITGFPWIIDALVLTILSGAAISLILLLTRVRSLRDPIPYGPFLIIGACITLIGVYPFTEGLIAH